MSANTIHQIEDFNISTEFICKNAVIYNKKPYISISKANMRILCKNFSNLASSLLL